MSTPLRILHVIVRLDQGGAEQSLLRLVSSTDDDKGLLEHVVVCVGVLTPLAQQIIDAGVTIHFVSFSPTGLWRLRRLIHALSPDIVQGWMYYGNLLASVLTPRGRGSPSVIWNVRSEQNAALALKIRLAIMFSRCFRPATVIYNSNAGCKSHTGFRQFPHTVINNGIDTDHFRPDERARAEFRSRLGAQPTDTVMALVGRYHPDKGITEYLQLVRQFQAQDVHCLMIGPGMEVANSELATQITLADLNHDQVQLLGTRQHLADLYPGLDLLVLASYREGAPNVLLEAMACGVTVVGTDVGDVAEIIDDTKRVCEPRDSAALQQVVAYALDHIGEFAERDRQRILEGYDSARCRMAYLQLYRHIAGTSE